MIFDFLPIIFEALAVLLAITYLLLAVRQDIRCWFAGILSSLIYLYLMFSVNLYMESVLQIFYVGMGFYGWFKWNKSQQMSNNSNTKQSSQEIPQFDVTLGRSAPKIKVLGISV